MPYHLITANFLMILAFLFKLNKLPPELPIFYSRPWGEFQIADWWYISLLPILMNVLYFLNIFLAKKLFPENEFVKNVIRYFNLFLIIALVVIFLKVILLVT